jgi:NADPH2:quinone reductase
MPATEKTMRAVIADEIGPPECYHLRELPDPVPREGQVRVRIHAASIGYFDALLARGGYQIKPPVPFVPGSEFAGVVDATGPGVEGLSAGDRVFGGGFGGIFAELLCIDASALLRVPAGVSLDAAASVLVNYQTALFALRERGALKPGETLLVLGAAGGTGIAAVQVGHELGARVIAGASTEEKREFARRAGADEVLDYSLPGWRDALKALTSGRGVDVVFDPVGGELFEPAFRSLAWNGRHLVIGFVGGAIPRLPANLALLKGASLVGVDLRQYGVREPAGLATITRDVCALLAAGRIAPPVGPVFPLEDFRAALEAGFSGKSLGKVVLRIAPADA